MTEDLRVRYNSHMATKEATQADGQRDDQPTEPVLVDIIILIDTNENLPPIEAYIRENSPGYLETHTDMTGPAQAGIWKSQVNLELLQTIATMG